jgi:hypothetical protein
MMEIRKCRPSRDTKSTAHIAVRKAYTSDLWPGRIESD